MTQVIIDDIIPRTQLVASAGQTVFNTNWTADAASDILVYSRAAGIPANDVTQLVSSSDYNVTFIGGSQTVRVTFLVGRTLDDVVTIVRDTPAERTNLYINTNFVPSMLNQDFGILTLVDQQAQMYDYVVNPGYNVSATIESIVDTVLPILAANQVWAMNEDRTAIIAYDVPAGGGVAPSDAKYLLQVADSELPNAQAMGALASGFVVNTTATGVQLTRVLTPIANQTAIVNGTGVSGNPTIGLADNAIFPGFIGVGIPTGTTAQRPVSPIGTDFRFNSDLIILEYWDGSDWVQISETDGVVTAEGTANQIDVNGSSGVPVDGAIVLSLPAVVNLPGSFNIQGTTAIVGIINDSSMSTATTSNISSSAAIKAYVDSLVTGLNIQGSCVCGTTTALTVTYGNGVSGVGATLTNAGVQAALSLDGVSPTVGQRVLVKNQASSLQNGIYTVTVVGSGATNWVMTRATDYDTPAEIQKGDLVILTGGTTQTQSSWVQTATVTAVGVDAITFIQFTASLPVNVASGGTGVTSFTAFAPIVGGLTTTGSLQSITLGASGTLFQSAGVGVLPGFTTTTYPVTNAINTIMYASSANVLGVVTPTNNGVLVYSAGGVPSSSTTLPTGLTIPGYAALDTTPSFTNLILTGAAIQYTGGFTMLGLGHSPGAVNSVTIFNNVTGAAPSYSAQGTDTNVGLLFATKGTGIFQFESEALTNQFSFLTGTGFAHTSIMNFPATAASRTYTWPDAAGTILITGQAINSVPSITFSSTSGVIGTTTNDSAAAGSVGEYITSNVPQGSPVSIGSTGATINVTSISLTAGDWDVHGNVIFLTTSASRVIAWTSNTSASIPDGSLYASQGINGGVILIANSALTVPFRRVSLSGTTTVYLSAYADFPSGTVTAAGTIYARRVR